MTQNQGGALAVGTVKRMMEVTKKPSGGYHVIINPSSLDIIQTCLRKAQFQLRDDLVPLEDSAATTFGKGIHKFLETFYMEPRENRSLPHRYKENISLICAGHTVQEDHFVYRAARAFYDETRDALMGLPDDDKRSLLNGAWIMSEYLESRITDPYEVFIVNGQKCIETMYQAVLYDRPDLTIEIHGTVDAILINKANDSLVICDHKTTSASTMNDFYNRTKPNYQYSMYVWLVEEVLKLGIENFMINVVQVKPRPKTSRGAGPHFLSIMTKRTPEDIEEMTRGVIFYVKQYLQCLDQDYFPLSTANACANYGRCSFLEVCESPSRIQKSILEANFKQRGATQ